MPILRAANTVVHHLHGASFTAHANPTAGSTDLCVWQLVVPPGLVGQPHRVHRAEVLVLTTGTLRVTLGEETAEASAGDTIMVPAGTLFQVDNISEEPASALVSTTAGFTAELADGTEITPPWAR